jgi:hypothetical protein
MTAFRTSSASSARLLKFKSVTRTHLKQQIAAYQTSIKKQRQTIIVVEDEFGLSRELIANQSDFPLADIIVREIIPRVKEIVDSPTPKTCRRCDIME